jgi:hypothetical protein
VALAGFTGHAETSANLSTTNPEVQTALKIIDRVLASRGFAPTANPNLKVAGSLVTYDRFTADGHSTIFPSISVRLNGNTLEFVIRNRPDLRLEDKQILKAVTTELRSHYGTAKVKTSG